MTLKIAGGVSPAIFSLPFSENCDTVFRKPLIKSAKAVGGKDPLTAADDFFRGSLEKGGNFYV